MGCFWNQQEKKHFYLPEAIGHRAENITLLALRALLGESKIEHFCRCDHNGTADRKGVDFKVFYRGVTIKLQTKSSLYGAQHHLEKHPDIPVVIVHCSHLSPRQKTTFKKRIQTTKENLEALNLKVSQEGSIII